MKPSFFFIPFLVVGSATAIPMIPPLRFSDGIVTAPLYAHDETETISHHYIVVLQPTLDACPIDTHHQWLQRQLQDIHTSSFQRAGVILHSRIDHIYNTPHFKGYAGQFSSVLVEDIRKSPHVLWVEKNIRVSTMELQRGAPWGLARISHQDALSLRTFNQYAYSSEAGKDVTVYVVDTGIHTGHADFEGRAVWGQTLPTKEEDVDGNGHGTHCAGTIAGKKYGVAKKARLVAVKVLRSNGSGSMMDVIAGVDWATQQHLQEKAMAEKTGRVFKGSVANMSLGGGKSNALDMAVNGAVEAGMVFVVAAGNDNRDACGSSPASAELAIAVGASTIEDERAYFSNYGSCVDVFAPGMNILSAWKGGDYATKMISGTSMASPHVAGLAAYLLSKANTTAKEIKDQIIEMSIADVLSSLPSKTPNLLVYNGETVDKPR
ncbi:serine protease [Spinellus fusiger]|nr:serine protease [Spinellus fusiger]